MAKKEKKAAKGKKKTAGLSINSISFVSFIMFNFVLTAGLYLGQQDPLSTLASQRQQVATSKTEKVAVKFAAEVKTYSNALNSIANDPATVRLFSEKNLLSWQQREGELKTIFPKALRVRLLDSDTSQPDKTNEPHLTYACLDLMNQSKASVGFSTQVEMHEILGKNQHIDMMQAVTLRGRVIGYIQLSVEHDMLTSWVQNAAGDAYVEVHQKVGKDTHLIATAGTENKQGITATVPVAGTNWSVSTWVAYQASESAFNTGMIFALGMGILLSGLVVFILRTLLLKELKSDLDHYLQLITSTLRNDTRHQVDFSLKEFRVAAEQVKNIRLDTGSMERERDLEGKGEKSKSQASLPEVDPMFMKDDSIALEELDSMDDTGPSALDELDSLDDTSNSAAPVASTPPANLPPIPEEIFKAYDIRGVVGKTLTKENIFYIGQALGSEARDRGLTSIVFARDGRLSGPELGQQLVKGLMASGIDVIDVGMAPTPLLYYAATELSKSTGAMLTGSHNPPDYNGIKMMIGGETLSGETIQTLRQRIMTGNLASGEGKYSQEKILEKYIQRVTGDVKLKRKLKIVIDCGNGVAGAVAPKLFTDLGCDVTPLFCEVDGKFPNHHPDPSVPENLSDLIAEVRKQNADLGLAFDGDGDRIGVVSGDGKVIWPDRLMMLFAKDVLSRNPGANIIYDIKCSSNLKAVIEENGGNPMMWKTGHSLIKAKMKESNAQLAGEMSGHIFFKERWYGFDDALYSSARLLEILAAQLRQPRVVFSGLADSVNTPELKINMQEGEHFDFIEKLKAQSSQFSGAEITLIDGIRVDYPDGWGLVRASNTTPCLVLRFEGKDRQAMSVVQEKFREVLTALQPGIVLPF